MVKWQRHWLPWFQIWGCPIIHNNVPIFLSHRGIFVFVKKFYIITIRNNLKIRTEVHHTPRTVMKFFWSTNLNSDIALNSWNKHRFHTKLFLPRAPDVAWFIYDTKSKMSNVCGHIDIPETTLDTDYIWL